MYYGQLYNCDPANGPGMRVTLFVSGCTHHCEGCFNEETWNFDYGMPYTKKTEQEILDLLKEPYINGLTLLGGEPMEPANQKVLLPLLQKVKEQYPDKTIWVYSGFTFEQLTGKEPSHACCDTTRSMLEQCDILVDGEFHLQEKNVMLPFRGSANQRVLNLPASLEAHAPVWEEQYR